MTVDFDEVVEYIIEGQKGMAKAMDVFCHVLSTDYEKIYSDYAESIGKPSLTKEEKEQAILDYILEQADDK